MPRSRLQSQLRQSRPFDSLEEEALLNLLRTADLLQNRMGRLFREHDLTASRYNVLRILRGNGEPLPALEIASRLIQVVPAITGLVDGLEKQGRVKRRRCSEDRRVIYVEITSKGLEVLDGLDGEVEDLHRELLGHLGRRELRDLIRLLEKAREPSEGD